jgi:YfiH family protein
MGEPDATSGHPDQVVLLPVWPMADLGVDAVVTTRAGGVSHPPYDTLNLGLHVGDEDDRVVANRERLAATYGCHLDDMVFLDQCHGTRVATVDGAQAGRGSRFIENALSATDAVITATVGLPLVIQVADCTPLVLVDPVAGILGLAHAGWRGAVGGVGPATVAAMEAAGAQVDRLHAWIGPGVDVERYEVGSEVVEAAVACGGEEAVQLVGGSTHLDTAALNRLLLEAAGISADHITGSELRTSDRRLFSDRHARPCGRFAVVARLTGAPAVASGSS